MLNRGVGEGSRPGRAHAVVAKHVLTAVDAACNRHAILHRCVKTLDGLLHVGSENKFKRWEILKGFRQICLRTDANHLLLIVQVEELEILVAHLLLSEALSSALHEFCEAVADLETLGLTIATNLDRALRLNCLYHVCCRRKLDCLFFDFSFISLSEK